VCDSRQESAFRDRGIAVRDGSDHACAEQSNAELPAICGTSSHILSLRWALREPRLPVTNHTRQAT
jgi:hypothetical protein